MRENGRKKKASKKLCINSFSAMSFFSQFISWTLYIPTIKQNIFYIFIIHLLKICQNILFLQIYFYQNGIWCWSHAFREKISLQLVLGSMSLAWKKEIVNLLLDFGSSIMCWFFSSKSSLCCIFISFAYIHQLVTSNFCCAKVKKKKNFTLKAKFCKSLEIREVYLVTRMWVC